MTYQEAFGRLNQETMITLARLDWLAEVDASDPESTGAFAGHFAQMERNRLALAVYDLEDELK